jgi:mono/diheme cytochrome c family protein
MTFWKIAGSVVFAAWLAGGGTAFAANPGDEGRSLAIDGCSACHQVTPAQKRPQPVFDPDQAMAISAPTFAEIARKYRERPGRLRRFILDPKHPMPEQAWDAKDLRAIVAYIQGLSSESRRP